MERVVDALSRELEEIDDACEEIDDPGERVRIGARRIGLIGSYVSVLRTGGWLSPESVAAAQQKAEPARFALREEFAREANGALRRLFHEHDIPPEVAEQAYDEVIIAAGLGHILSARGGDNAQA